MGGEREKERIMIAPARVGMSLDDFIREYARQPFELMGDERIARMPNVAEHQLLVKLLYKLLSPFEDQGLIELFFDMPFVLAHGADWVTGSRVPDLMVVRKERMTRYKAEDADWLEKPLILVPDLCIEIVSPNDIYTEVEAKVERYLADGVQIVWVVNPRQQSVTVHRADGGITRLTRSATLDGGALMPELAVEVGRLFAA
jgi:Uma2 family endonuclease